MDRSVSARDEALIRGFLAEHLPAGSGPRKAAATCLYTMTPDGDFGEKTANATRFFQAQHGLRGDGIAGENTLQLAASLGFSLNLVEKAVAPVAESHIEIFSGIPRTGAHVSVEQKSVPFFKTGKEMRERLNKNGAA